MNPLAAFVLGMGVAVWLVPPANELIVRLLAGRSLIYPDNA